MERAVRAKLQFSPSPVRQLTVS